MTFGQSSNWLVLIISICMVSLEKLCNTTPGSGESLFYSILPIDSLIKDIWGLTGVWNFDFWSKF